MKRQILFLTLKTFSFTGGIEKVCRIFAKVLNDLNWDKGIKSQIWSMYDSSKDLNPLYSNSTFRGFNGQQIRLILSVLWKHRQFDTIILSHINLILVAWLVRLFSSKKRIILFAHGIEVWKEIPSWKKRFLREAGVEIWAVSRYTAEILNKKHQMPSGQIKIVNNCLDPFLSHTDTFAKPLQLLQRYQLDQQQPVLFTLTRLTSSEKYKGYDLIINLLPELIQDYPDLIYIIGGKADIDEYKRLTVLIEEKNLDSHVNLAGYISDTELSDYFKLADVFVMPSRKEGFGLVFIEAAANGCKVIGGNQDGSIDALLDGRLGKLVDPTNANEIKNAVTQYLNIGRSDEQSKKIQQDCLAKFNYANYYNYINQLLQSA